VTDESETLWDTLAAELASMTEKALAAQERRDKLEAERMLVPIIASARKAADAGNWFITHEPVSEPLKRMLVAHGLTVAVLGVSCRICWGPPPPKVGIR
jgi:hypothetical protein